MRAALWLGVDRVETADVGIPELEPGWALVKVAFTGLCGTDLAIYHGQHPRATPPLIMGHELSGTVVATATATANANDSIAIGDLVAAEPLISCGECWACTHGHPHVCRRLGLYGIDAPGGLAEYVALPADRLHVLPPGVSPRLAALVEPLAVAVHSVENSGLRPGDTVAVFGAGPIGMLTALVARHEGARQMLVTDPNPWRRGIAEQLGFTVVPEGETMTATVRTLTDDEGADVTFDTAGHPSVAAEVADATRVLGTIVVVAVYKHPAEVDLRHVNFSEQRMQGVRVYTTADVRRAVELVSDDRLGLEKLPVRVFGLDDVPAAFEAARTGDHNLKVLVSPSGEGVTE